MELGPGLIEPLTEISGIVDAIKRNDWISDERRQFLIERIPYWTAWARSESRGIIASGDVE